MDLRNLYKDLSSKKFLLSIKHSSGIYEEILSQKELKSVQSKLDSIVKKRKRNTDFDSKNKRKRNK